MMSLPNDPHTSGQHSMPPIHHVRKVATEISVGAPSATGLQKTDHSELTCRRHATRNENSHWRLLLECKPAYTVISAKSDSGANSRDIRWKQSEPIAEEIGQTPADSSDDFSPQEGFVPRIPNIPTEVRQQCSRPSTVDRSRRCFVLERGSR